MIFALLQRQAQQRPTKTAIIQGDRSVTYAGLAERVSRCAAALADIGVVEGTVVATCLENSIENLVGYFAAALNGATLCTLDVTLTGFELAQVFADCKPRFVLTQSSCLDRVNEALNACRLETTVIHESSKTPNLTTLLAGAHGSRAGRPTTQSDDFLVQYTSGSTGKPKGVVQTQLGLSARVRNWQATGRLTAEDTHFCMLPLSHGYGNYIVALPALASGGTLHLADRSMVTPAGVLAYVASAQITCLYALPYFYRLAIDARHVRDVDLGSLRICMVGAAPVNGATLDGFEKRFGVRLNNCYGTSESGIITFNPSSDPTVDPISVGKPIAGMDVQLEEHPGISGGELCAASEGVAKRYFSDDLPPVASGGWQRTGDLAQRVGDYFFITGRLSQFINVSGNKVMPEEIESVILELGAVQDVAVCPAEDRVMGQTIVAFVVRRGSVSDGEIKTYCRERLTGFKVPTRIEFVAKLPVNAVGKVQRGELVRRIGDARTV